VNNSLWTRFWRLPLQVDC